MILMSNLKIVSVYSRKQIMIERQAIKSNRKIRKNVYCWFCDEMDRRKRAGKNL